MFIPPRASETAGKVAEILNRLGSGVSAETLVTQLEDLRKGLSPEDQKEIHQAATLLCTGIEHYESSLKKAKSLLRCLRELCEHEGDSSVGCIYCGVSMDDD